MQLEESEVNGQKVSTACDISFNIMILSKHLGKNLGLKAFCPVQRTTKVAPRTPEEKLSIYVFLSGVLGKKW